jgi:hypothetical protein
LPCPINSSCPPPQPICTKLAFHEDFKNFQDKITSGQWVPPNVPGLTLLNEDGKLIQECDGVTIDSNKYTLALAQPYTSYQYSICKLIPYQSTFRGVCIEFTVSEITKYVSSVRTAENGQFDPFYECSGQDPEEDPRLAYSAVTLTNNNFTGDLASIEVVFCKKKIFVSYGIDVVNSGLRDRFHVFLPVADRNGTFDEKFIYTICLGYDGSAQVYNKDPVTCQYTCVANINNIGVPPTDKKYIVATYASNTIANPTNTPVFLYEPINFTDIYACVGNYKAMQYMETNPIGLPKTTLYNVTGDNTNGVFRYLCECGNTLLPSVTVVTLPDGTSASTAQLNYGQGATLKMYNLDACYM